MSDISPTVAESTTFIPLVAAPPASEAGGALSPAHTVTEAIPVAVIIAAEDSAGCLDAALRDSLYPGEPFGTTTKERTELWLIRAQEGGRLGALYKKYNTIYEIFTASRIFLSIISFTSLVLFLLVTAVGFVEGKWNPFPWLVVLTALTCSATAISYTERFQKVFKDKCNILWREHWYHRLHIGIIGSHITMPAPLLAVAMSTESWNLSAGTELSPADHVAMMRLTAMLESSVSTKLAKSLTLSGETDELCCRVLSAMGQDSIKAVEHVKSMSDLKL